MNKYEITEACIVTYNTYERIAESTNFNPIGLKFDKDNLLNYIVQLTCELTSYERLTFGIQMICVEHKNKKIGVYSEKEYDRTYKREYVFVSWTEDGEQTYYEFDVIK